MIDFNFSKEDERENLKIFRTHKWRFVKFMGKYDIYKLFECSVCHSNMREKNMESCMRVGNSWKNIANQKVISCKQVLMQKALE